MTPVIGELLPGFHLQPDEGEVAEVFEVPLAFLMDPDRHVLHRLETSLGPWALLFRDPLAIPFHLGRYGDPDPQFLPFPRRLAGHCRTGCRPSGRRWTCAEAGDGLRTRSRAMSTPSMPRGCPAVQADGARAARPIISRRTPRRGCRRRRSSATRLRAARRSPRGCVRWRRRGIAPKRRANRRSSSLAWPSMSPSMRSRLSREKRSGVVRYVMACSCVRVANARI